MHLAPGRPERVSATLANVPLADPAGRETPTPKQTSLLRQVALPGEHGGWSLTAEPILLGLLVVFSWPGVALGLAALLAFMVRTPLKVVLVDRWRGRWLDRTRLALRVTAVELTAIAALGLAAAADAADWFWIPLAVAVPLVVLELWFDMRSRSRRLVPELAGTVAIGSVAAAIALADGAAARPALGLWLVMAARAVAAIPYVRLQLARGHGRAVRPSTSDLAQVLAVGVAVVALVADAIAVAPVLVMAAVGVMNSVAVRLRPRPAVAIGVEQMIVGLVVVVVTAVTSPVG